jgi:hypothetical protein
LEGIIQEPVQAEGGIFGTFPVNIKEWAVKRRERTGIKKTNTNIFFLAWVSFCFDFDKDFCFLEIFVGHLTHVIMGNSEIFVQFIQPVAKIPPIQ